LPIGNRSASDYAYTNFGIHGAAEAAPLVKGLSWLEACTTSVWLIALPGHGPGALSQCPTCWLSSNRAALHARHKVDGWVARYQRKRRMHQQPAGGASALVRDLARG